MDCVLLFLQLLNSPVIFGAKLKLGTRTQFLMKKPFDKQGRFELSGKGIFEFNNVVQNLL